MSLYGLQGLGFCLEVDHLEINGHEHEPQWSPFVGTPALRGRAKSQSANSALVLPDHYHPVNHTRCWWAPTRRTNVRSASLEQVLCKVCLSLLWIVQILSLYEKRLSQGITKKMTAPGVSRRHASAHSSPPTRQGHLQRKRSPRGDAQGVVHTNPKVQAFTPAYGHG